MKKSIVLFLLMCAFVGFSQAQQATNSSTELPANAQQIINEHFSDMVIVGITESTDDDDRYQVIFENGFEIEFDKNGNWTEIDGNRLKVPLALMPSQVNEHVRNHHPKVAVVKIEKENNNYKVKLSDGIEFVFDGNRIEYED